MPAGPSDPSVDLTRDRTMRIASQIGIDATRPFGEKFYDVADVPGWEDFKVPELDEWGVVGPSVGNAPLSSSAKADDPVIFDCLSILSERFAITVCPAFAGHDRF